VQGFVGFLEKLSNLSNGILSLKKNMYIDRNTVARRYGALKRTRWRAGALTRKLLANPLLILLNSPI
jgi:hypothetical protein